MNISEQELIQNLKDTGCDNKQIKELMELYKQGKNDDICKILETHRKKVLNIVHKKEKQIDCIDYFIYNMEKNK